MVHVIFSKRKDDFYFFPVPRCNIQRLFNHVYKLIPSIPTNSLFSDKDIDVVIRHFSLLYFTTFYLYYCLFVNHMLLFLMVHNCLARPQVLSIGHQEDDGKKSPVRLCRCLYKHIWIMH